MMCISGELIAVVENETSHMPFDVNKENPHILKKIYYDY